MKDPRSPSRSDLAKFLPDQRTIRAFEKLFELVPDELTVLIEEALITAGNSDSKSNQALDSLTKIADSLDFLMKQPPPEKHNSIYTDYIDMPIDGPHVTKERRLQWNEDDGTFDAGVYNDVIYQLGQELGYYAKNTSGSFLANGTPVMLTGAVGVSGKLTFGPSVSDGTYPPEYMMGVLTQDSENNSFSYITDFGLVRGINTTGTPYGETWNDGDLLYFNPASAGSWTNVQPFFPAIRNPVAVVVNAAAGGSGSIFVRFSVDQIGGLSKNILTKTSNYTIVLTDYTVLCDSSAGSFTVTLPTASSAKGQIFNIKKTDSSGFSVIIDGNGTETIDGNLTVSIITPMTNIAVQSNGTEWFII